ncbi:MAG: hypothetical protein KAX49_04290 [Halanaerobiales bacterium]|nr:hypothetical protein [Halanaerobiales bacterium]
MWFLLLWVMGIISAGVDFCITGFPKDVSQICSTLLLHQFVVTFGLVGLIGFIVNIWKADETAKSLGWPGGPFQRKYGWSQIGLGVMGIMAIWFRGGFWLGVIVSMYIYGISGFFSHINVMRMNNKVDADSIGNLIMDVLYQGFITVLSVLATGIWVI